MSSSKDNKIKSNDYNISIKEEKYQKSIGLNEHYLSLKFYGKDCNIKLMNTLRRVSSNYIPVYAYAPELIKITENTSEAFNNDMMRLDLSVLPVFGIDPKLDELDEKYWYDVNYADNTRNKHPKEKNIEFYLNVHNNSQDYIRVTTNDVRVTVDGEDFKMYDEKYPILLIELTANQTFKCHMKAVLGIAENINNGAIWKGCFNSYYDEVNPGEFLFTVYGNNMFSEQKLLIRACKFIIKKMSKLKKSIIDKLNTKEITPEQSMQFIFDNEDYTTIGPINFELQEHKDIIYAGLLKPDQLIKSVMIKATCNNKVKSPIDALLDSIDVVEQKFTKIGSLLSDMYYENNNNKEEKPEKIKDDKKK